MFSTLHASTSHLQVEIAEKDGEITTLAAHHGLFELVRMQSGSTKAMDTV